MLLVSYYTERNNSICDPLKALASGRSVPIVAYNHLAWQRKHYFRLPVPTNDIQGNISFTCPLLDDASSVLYFTDTQTLCVSQFYLRMAPLSRLS